MNKQTIMEAAKKICNLYVWETAPLKVALGDGICGAIKQVKMEHYVMNREGLCIWGGARHGISKVENPRGLSFLWAKRGSLEDLGHHRDRDHNGANLLSFAVARSKLYRLYCFCKDDGTIDAANMIGLHEGSISSPFVDSYYPLRLSDVDTPRDAQRTVQLR